MPLSSSFKKFLRSPRSKTKPSRGHTKAATGDGHDSVSMAKARDCGTSGASSSSQQRIPNGVSDKEAELRQIFEMFDKNKDGKISSDELGCVLRTLGHEHSPREVDDMIKNADKNENGYVEFDEFLTLMKRYQEDSDPDSHLARKLEAFRVFDMDGNGYIDKHELMCVMRRLGENLTEEDLKEMFTEADLNGDGFIDFEEFSRLNMA
ncbi:calmodulin-A-like isoform X1 [Dreissena polymorpha]|uniref:calmodulin-A-like isoform X1 n=1 Tax=Dreissena polymorpha TaxID=45954 RepID=UPI002264D05E|nr:calmodulin-A-like isoform X1 [Dreissena polymorpha]